MSLSPAASAVVAPAMRICFNSHCKESKKDQPPRRKGWRLRSGDFASLCDCCGCAYEQGTFCETFHASDPGWRNCDMCGKRVHCGCIVSTPLYMLLDSGGIECIGCARSAVVNAPNQIRPLLPLQSSDRSKDLPTKSLSHMTGPYPGQWRQVPKIWTLASSQSELQRRISFEFERPNYHERVLAGGRFPSSQEKKQEDFTDRLSSSSLSQVSRETCVNGNNGLDTIAGYSTYQDSVQVTGENNILAKKGESSVSMRKGAMSIPSPSSSAGVNLDGYPKSIANVSSALPSIVKDESLSPLIVLPAPYPLSRDSKDQSREHPHGQPSSNSGKLLYSGSQAGSDIGCELQTQMRNGRMKAETRNRIHFHPRYCPKITNEELQQITGDSNSVITPLFEKVLSASDAGRIGRLVLPKKCAEAYFPTISQPEGLPLKVQDLNGKEWVFQFRFWPNNNSRMYVLEGVTPCIQSMQLQAGDTVTFSRMDPVGRLVMGFRKASNVSMEQDAQSAKAGNGISTPPEVNGSSTPESGTDASMRSISGAAELKGVMNAEDLTMRTDFIKKESQTGNLRSVSGKRRGNTPGSKSKRLRIENEESIELKITWEQAQELLRAPPNNVFTVVNIEGHEIEEFEEAPVIGRPTIFATDESSEKNQWAQCERCSKWRKLPLDALLPFRWTCSDNKWDSERSSCTSAQELSMEQLATLIPTFTGVSKKSKAKVENEMVVSDGLDTLANLAILGEGEVFAASFQAPTTKHPRHRPGCSCIVCIQPPSGKGPKHQQSCTCNVCLTVRRRFRTLMLRRERRQSEKEAEKKHQVVQAESPPPGYDDSITAADDPSSPPKIDAQDETFVDEEVDYKVTPSPSLSPLKAKIDLNIQPEREEELSNPREPTDAPSSPGWTPMPDSSEARGS